MKSMVINETNKGKRFDIVASEMLPELSRSYVTSLISAGGIKLSDRIEKPGYKLREGDEISIEADLESMQQIPDIDLPVIYEDNDVLVINKPEGVVSHSRGRYWYEPSVASFVRQKTGQEGDRAGIVHRLDRATSGVMVCAKNQAAMKHLQRQFSDRSVIKKYSAIIEGHISPKAAIIDMPIERNPKAPATFRVGANGKPAITEYKVLRSIGDYELVELLPKSGRTHQLRVHMKQLGHPIVGDHLYGTSGERLYLHAHMLEINLPNGVRKTFEAKLPKEFHAFMENY